MKNERFDVQTRQLTGRLHAARQRESLSYEAATLEADIRAHLSDLKAADQDEAFYHSVLGGITVYPDRKLDLRLNLLPPKWRYVLDSMADLHGRDKTKGCHFDPSVPSFV